MHWQHPVTGRRARCQFMVDVGSRAPMINRFLKKLVNAPLATDFGVQGIVVEGLVCSSCKSVRPRLIRMDPDGCYLSNEMPRHTSRSWNQHRGHSWRGTVEIVDHGCHHETGETNSTHLRVV